jgi:hypothetical protein
MRSCFLFLIVYNSATMASPADAMPVTPVGSAGLNVFKEADAFCEKVKADQAGND